MAITTIWLLHGIFEVKTRVVENQAQRDGVHQLVVGPAVHGRLVVLPVCHEGAVTLLFSTDFANGHVSKLIKVSVISGAPVIFMRNYLGFRSLLCKRRCLDRRL